MLHTMHSYLFVQHRFHRTNPIIHVKSRSQYANTKLTSPYYMIHSFINQPNNCEGTFRSFEPIKNYFNFSPLYAKSNRPILVPIEYMQCVQGGATKCTHGHTLSTSSTGTGWRINWIIANLPRGRRRYLTSSLCYSRTLTLTCIPMPLLIIWRVTQIS